MNIIAAIPNADVVFITLDSLRYDVAQHLFLDGKLPNFAKWLPKNGWEERYSPASFTFPAHQAFFAGFLPTKIKQKMTPRLFSAAFHGSESTVENTFVFDEATIVEALKNRNYNTVCIGGVGFFNKQTAIGNVFPSMFEFSEWNSSFSVTEKNSTENQLNTAVKYLETDKPVFLFVNVSATHQPTNIYLDPNKEDDVYSQKAALEYVDSKLDILQEALQNRKQETIIIVCSDHGTAYGEDQHWGHRNGHQNVMKVPYLELIKGNEN